MCVSLGGYILDAMATATWVWSERILALFVLYPYLESTFTWSRDLIKSQKIAFLWASLRG